MEEYNISEDYRIFVKTDSKGTQEKYHKNGYWYKVDKMGKEGLIEALISDILSCSNITNFVVYEQCVINGKNGCRSKDFTEENESFITFQKLYQNNVGGSLANKIQAIRTPEERFEFLVNFIKAVTELDCREYLQDNFDLDLLTRNPDRHFNNLGIIYNYKTMTYKIAPIFDNGQGLFQNYLIAEPHLPIEEKEKRFISATISSNFEIQVETAKSHLRFNYAKIEKVLEKYPKCEEVDYLRNQLEKYKKLFEEPTLLEKIIAGEDISEPGLEDDANSNKDNYDPADELY